MKSLMNIRKPHEVLAGIAAINNALLGQPYAAIHARPEKGMAVLAETPLQRGGKPETMPHGEPARLPNKPHCCGG